MRSGKFGSVAMPNTHAPISVDQDAMATTSSFRTRTGVLSNGAVSIGSQISSGSLGLLEDMIKAVTLSRLCLLNLYVDQVSEFYS
jgi:hypothetical protein